LSVVVCRKKKTTAPNGKKWGIDKERGRRVKGKQLGQRGTK